MTALLGITRVRVIDAAITAHLGQSGQQRVGTYRLITTLTDPERYPALDVVGLYHQRWEIETSFRETKSTILDGRVLRARTPAGVTQEVYAVLITHQALRVAMADAALTVGDLEPTQLSFTIALTTARDGICCASNDPRGASHRLDRAHRGGAADQHPPWSPITLKPQNRQTRDLQAPGERTRRQNELRHHDHDTPTPRSSLTSTQAR